MNLPRILLRNLVYFRKQHTGTCVGAALCSMILVGALTVGDSVRSTLSSLAEDRIGKADMALLATDGFFREDLANEMGEGLDESAVVAPIVLTRGTISLPDGSIRVNNIQVLGVDERFWSLAPNPAKIPSQEEKGFWANPRLFKRLKNSLGERIILRVEEPGLFSRDAPLSGERDDKFVSFNDTLRGVVPPEGFGSFGLQGNQREPLTLFVPIQVLQKKMFRAFDEEAASTAYANFLLLGTSEDGQVDPVSARKALDKEWTLEDAGISFKKLRTASSWSVRSRQVFLSPPLEKAVHSIAPKSEGVLTYLVNAIEHRQGDDSNESSLIPYSMASAIRPGSTPFMPEDFKSDEVILNEWAAKDLNASIGDEIVLHYFSVGERRKLIEQHKGFRLRGVVPMPQPVSEGEQSDWTPRFPGLADAESCGEWDTGIPITHEIRPRDERYWDEYRGSPKAFVSLEAGKGMWGNRWGSVTGMRLQSEDQSIDGLRSELQSRLSAKEAGLLFTSLRKDARAGVESPVDFGQLFLAFSFFVIASSLALTGMLFAFSMQQRNHQAGLLLSLGFSVRKVRMLFLGEGFLVSLIGVILGIGGAWLYGTTILGLLSGEWSGAVSGAQFEYSPTVNSLVSGAVGALAMSILAMTWSSRKQLKREPNDLLNSGDMVGRESHSTGKSKWLDSPLFAIAFLVAAVVLAWSTDFAKPGSSMDFFGVGALLLTSGILFFRSRLSVYAKSGGDWTGPADLNRRNAGRRIGRSLVTVGVMAAGSFIVVSTGAFRKNAFVSCHEKASGTGGFSFLGETSLPIYDDLNLIAGDDLDPYDLNKSLLGTSKVVPLRIRPGDDASCLNLNKAIRPTLYGVSSEEVKGRFSFSDGDWSLLDIEIDEGVVPVVVDQNTMMWALKMKKGDRMEFLDGSGKPFFVELAAVVTGSILQGGLYMSEDRFLEKFPKQGGYRAFLIEEKPALEGQVAEHLEDRLSNYGMEFVSTAERLRALQKVENTYLSIFQGLGGLGLLLGTAGLAVVVARNLVERGKEFALLEAVGYRLGLLRKLAFDEHILLGLWGLGVGSTSAMIGIAPALFGSVGELPGAGFLWFFLALLLLSLFWTWFSVRLVLRTSKLPLLRDE